MKDPLNGLLGISWTPVTKEYSTNQTTQGDWNVTYVDGTDFAGSWKYGNHDSPESVLSRTGYTYHHGQGQDIPSCMPDVQLLGEANYKQNLL